MVVSFKIIGLAFLLCLIMTLGSGPRAGTPGIRAGVVAGASTERPEVGSLTSLAPRVVPIGRKNLSGNPLWTVHLMDLTATCERPIFSVSRRPPPRVTAVPNVEPVKAPGAQKAPERELPALELIGAVVGGSEAIAVFLDPGSRRIVRLRAGDAYAGWMLSSVLPRAVTLKKADRMEVLLLQRRSASSNVQPLPMPTSVATDKSYAPFVPRSTPKNGEPDGL
jgi:general secretion pathway protein N